MTDSLFFIGIAVGAGFVFVSCWVLIDRIYLAKRGKSVSATVIDNIRVSSNRYFKWAEVFEYRVNDIKYVCRGGSHTKPKYEIGQRIQLKYKEKNPYSFIIDSVGERNSDIILVILFFIAGAMLIAWVIFFR